MFATGSSTDTYTIAAANNRVSKVTSSPSGNVRTFTYLATGQASGDTRNPSSAYVYNYNKTGRLSTASLNGSTVGTYLMNGLEQRVSKVVGSTTTQFVFDRYGHLLAEANGSTGATQKEYIWLDDLPVAEVDDTGSSPVIYYVHADHLGRPQKMTDATATIVWDGVFDPFGNVTSVTGSTTNLLMFPGQYYDSETQLSQNWNRDYDPSIGRYIQSDPIGLKGGVNTYNYVFENPQGKIDRDGLQVAIPLGPLEMVNPEAIVPEGTLDPAISGSKPDTPDPNKRDCCEGLRKQLRDHEQKLQDYMSDPYGNDNKGFLGQGRDQQVIDGRIRNLQNQIDNFRKQLEKCEEENSGGGTTA